MWNDRLGFNGIFNGCIMLKTTATCRNRASLLNYSGFRMSQRTDATISASFRLVVFDAESRFVDFHQYESGMALTLFESGEFVI